MIDRIIISEEESVEDALSIMNETGLGLVILTDPEKRLRAVASAGDLRRALLKGKKGKLSDVANYHPISAEKGTKTEVLVDLASKAGKVVITEQQKVVDLFMDHSDMPLSIRGEQLERLACTPGEAMKDVMKRIDMSGLGIALVVEEGRLAGVVTDSDIRSAILAGAGDEEPIKKVMVKDFVRATEDMQKEKIRALNPPGKRLKIPVLDKQGKVLELVQVESSDYGFLSSRRRKMECVLVTGGAGYIGSILVRMLLDRGYRVVVLDRLLYGKESIKELEMNPNFKLIVGDIRHIEDITKAIQGVDAVVHLAGIVGDPACALYPLSTIEQNYLSTVLLAKICKYNQINRFVFASSCSVYGQGKEILDEDSSLSPVSLYARDKINSEKALLELEDENFSPTILRMGTIYGMSYRPRFDLVLNIITALAATKGEFTINGGDQWRPMVHVADAASAYVLALESSLDDVKGQVFNVGSEEQNYRIIELGETVRRMIPSKMIISEDNVDKRDYRVDFGKIRKLGFIAKHTIEEGVWEIGDAVRKGLQFQDKKNSNYRFLSS